jgi:proteic killer suppression protein
VIRSFRSKPLRRFAERGDRSKLGVQNVSRVERILVRLNAASIPEQMNVPGLGFHPLKGGAEGRFSVWVTGNWRITFGWDGEDAIEVDLEDYH